MDHPSFLPRSKSSSFSSTSSTREEKYLLPLSSTPPHRKPKIRVRTILGHCLYRRVIIWTVTALFLLCMGLMASSSSSFGRPRILGLVDFQHRKQDAKTAADIESVLLLISEAMEEEEEEAVVDEMPGWLQFRRLDGYFNGLKTLVPIQNYTPSYPNLNPQKPPLPFPIPPTPKPKPYTPHHDPLAKTCYLDKESTIPAPDIYAYLGVIQGQPDPVIGSYSLLGLRQDVCFDRFGRYGPYGLGYSLDEGGVEVGMDTEREGAETVWEKTGRIDYGGVDWGDAQCRCHEGNRGRFRNTLGRGEGGDKNGEEVGYEGGKIERMAVVVRIYVGFVWTQHAILNFRAMISELSLRSGGEYDVHFLLHVRDDYLPIWADGETAQRVLDENVPPEFHSICTLWSEAQMRLLYPIRFGSSVENPSNSDIHGVYRSAHFPLQHFAMTHSQYKHFWNWEMDMRWLGNYYELFDRLGVWTKEQPRVGMWERSAKYYIPGFHGSWDNFTELVRRETEASGREAVFGPAVFPGKRRLRSEEHGGGFMPGGCQGADGDGDGDESKCGVGEEADLIMLNPLFDPEESGWVFSHDVTGYNGGYPVPPRRSAIITASRLSRRLLEVMHEETWRLRHNMFSEMFPASMALHHGLKAVYAPHPVFLDREWDLESVDEAFNGGRDRTSGGKGSPFDMRNEHNHRGSTWYYNSEFAGGLWRRWLGNGEGDEKGGTGRMCLRGMLVHPVKWEHPDEY